MESEQAAMSPPVLAQPAGMAKYLSSNGAFQPGYQPVPLLGTMFPLPKSRSLSTPGMRFGPVAQTETQFGSLAGLTGLTLMSTGAESNPVPLKLLITSPAGAMHSTSLSAAFCRAVLRVPPTAPSPNMPSRMMLAPA